jgi:hypothetical protein
VTKMLASTIEDQLRVTMLSMHMTYPLCGWVQFGASKCGIKLVGELSIGAGGGDAYLTSPEMQDRLHSPGATSCGRMGPRSGKAEWCRGS